VRWLVPGNIITQIQATDPAAARVLDIGTFTIEDPAGRNLTYTGATPVARYRSFAQFQADLKTRTIDPAYRWVLYDPENWPDTPVSEQLDPWTAMQDFGQYAHAHGYRVISAPARDLGNVATGNPKLRGEDLNAWYLRTGIPVIAGRYADVVDIQAQAVTLDLPAYDAFVREAGRDALDANPYVTVLAGVSTRYGTALEMAAAARSVTVAGYWLNVPGPDPGVGKACEFLRLMTGGTS
jgi:hypothetical protein